MSKRKDKEYIPLKDRSKLRQALPGVGGIAILLGMLIFFPSYLTPKSSSSATPTPLVTSTSTSTSSPTSSGSPQPSSSSTPTVTVTETVKIEPAPKSENKDSIPTWFIVIMITVGVAFFGFVMWGAIKVFESFFGILG